MKVLRTTALTLILMMSPGCCLMDVRKDYIAADRATFDAITPKYLEYVGADSSLTDEEKKRRAMTVTTWEMRLKRAEEAPEPGATPDGE